MKNKNSFSVISFDNSYSALSNKFFVKLNPAKVTNPTLIKLNEELAVDLGLNVADLKSSQAVEFFSGKIIAKGSDPIATAYAGHQFGHFSPSLGDGRAILLGEILDKNSRRFDIQLKGSGQTPFSRRGDGKSALGPVIREYVISEAMYYLGISTTRSLAAVATGEDVIRENVVPGGILTRVAASHIRVGTFEYFAARGDKEAVKELADYAIKRHYPNCLNEENPYQSFLKSVIDDQAKLVCEWMRVGFIHGVMNTDNMAICGQTIDYGPCAFMDIYNSNTVFSSIDTYGRYAFEKQSYIANWNLTRFAECLLPLLDDKMNKAIEIAEIEINSFTEIFDEYWLDMMCCKLGLLEKKDGDLELIKNLLKIMQDSKADYTLSFRFLFDVLSGKESDFKNPFTGNKNFDEWKNKFEERIALEIKPLNESLEVMNKVNPTVIPRNHIVEELIEDAVNGDYLKMEKFLKVVKNPYEKNEGNLNYRNPPERINNSYRTFCGT